MTPEGTGATALLAISAAAALLVLPGCWISFLLPLKGATFWGRIAFGFVLSPLVLYGQFVAVRSLGASFDAAIWALILMNLPPLAPVLLARPWAGRIPPRRTCLAYGLAFLPAAAALASGFFPEERRVYIGGHSWLRTDVTYSLASGDLPPEERMIAGLRLGYPWAFYAQQAVYSRLLGTPHFCNYYIINIFWLIVVSSFAAGIARELGAGPGTRALSLIFLYFGVNFVGSILMAAVPDSVVPFGVRLWGDERYTPWLIKFCNATPMIPGLGFVAALLYALVRDAEAPRGPGWTALIGCLVVGTGIIYPLLLPAACVFVCARIGALLAERFVFGRPEIHTETMKLGAVLLVGAAFSCWHLGYITRDREVGGMVGLASPMGMARRVVEDAVVLSVLLAGLPFSLRSSRRESGTATSLLLLGAAASIALNVVLSIPGYDNEYKYIFTASMCLSAFPAIALRPVVRGLGRGAVPAVALIALALSTPALCRGLFSTIQEGRRLEMDLDRFEPRLAAGEPLAPVVEAIRERTPPDSVLVLDRWDFYWPIPTCRSAYIAPAEKPYLLGTNVPTDLQLKEAGGYGGGRIDSRRAVVSRLYRGPDERERLRCLREIFRLGRPVVLILERDRHDAVLRWLQDASLGALLAEATDGGIAAWFVPSLGEPLPDPDSPRIDRPEATRGATRPASGQYDRP